MTILSNTLALVALFGFIFIWVRLKKMKTTVDHLEQMHASSKVGKVVELKGLSSIPLAPLKEKPKGVSSFESLIILGFREEAIFIDNQSNGKKEAKKDISIEIPEGTIDVVPLVSGFDLFYGKIESIEENTSYHARVSDHHLGFERVNIRVIEIGRVTATIQAQMWLCDDNQDDAWTGTMHAMILFLGPHP